MGKDASNPNIRSSGKRPPPRPPRDTDVGLFSDGDDSVSKYPATITKLAKGEGRFIRQPDGLLRKYGHVIIEIQPNGRGKGNEIINEASNRAIPKEYIKSVMNGLRYGLDHGIFINYSADNCHPIVDVVVHIIGG